MATIGILGSHFAGDFFLGVDIMVTSMLVNFLLMCLTLIYLPKKNPAIAQQITVLTSSSLRTILAYGGVLILSIFLVIHIWKDLHAEVTNWYFHSTPIWLIVMSLASLIYYWQLRKIRANGVDLKMLFGKLPEE